VATWLELACENNWIAAALVDRAKDYYDRDEEELAIHLTQRILNLGYICLNQFPKNTKDELEKISHITIVDPKTTILPPPND